MRTSSFGPTTAVEHDRLRRHRQIRFRRVIGVIEPDADELADASDTRPDAFVRRHDGQRRWIELRETCERFGQERIARDIADDAGQVADRAAGIEKAGFFAAGSAVSQQLHESVFP
jgi:hypothetical protein